MKQLIPWISSSARSQLANRSSDGFRPYKPMNTSQLLNLFEESDVIGVPRLLPCLSLVKMFAFDALAGVVADMSDKTLWMFISGSASSMFSSVLSRASVFVAVDNFGGEKNGD